MAHNRNLFCVLNNNDTFKVFIIYLFNILSFECMCVCVSYLDVVKCTHH